MRTRLSLARLARESIAVELHAPNSCSRGPARSRADADAHRMVDAVRAQPPHPGDDRRCVKVDGQDRCKIAIQSNNVETDDRGYIYVVDRANTGLHILEVTGEAREVAGMK